MKTVRLLSLALFCSLLVPPIFAATDVVAGWYAELTDVQQSFQQSIGGRERATTVLRAAIDAASHGLPTELPPAGANLNVAAAHAAYSVLVVLYPQSLPALDAQLAGSLAGTDDTATATSTGKDWGKHVAEVILAEQSDAVFLNPSSFALAEKAPDAPPSVPAAQAATAEIGSGRYEFAVLAGSPGTKGHVDGMRSAARFDHPGGIAVDAAGIAYVSEYNMNTIRKITPDGNVTTLAGTPGQKGSADGTGAAARFNQPQGLAVDAAGNVYVGDSGNHTIRKIDPAGKVTTIAGQAGVPGTIDGNRETARLLAPSYLAVDAGGNVYFSEIPPDSSRLIYYPSEIPLKAYPERAIRKVAPDGTVSSLKIAIVLPSDTAPRDRRYYRPAWPYALGVDPAGNLSAIYSDDWEFSDAVKLTPTSNGEYEGHPLPSPGVQGLAECLAVDVAGNVYVKYDSKSIYYHTPEGAVEIRYGEGNSGGFFWTGMSADPDGTLVVLPRYDRYTEKTGIVEVGTFTSYDNGLAITLQPLDASAGPTGSVRFAAQAIGASKITYQWFFNSNPIPGATGEIYEIQNIQAQNAGTYFAAVSDGTRSIYSRGAKLVVTEASVSGLGSGTTDLVGKATAPSSGGGSFDQGISLAVLGLLAAAAVRRRYRISPVVAAEPL